MPKVDLSTIEVTVVCQEDGDEVVEVEDPVEGEVEEGTERNTMTQTAEDAAQQNVNNNSEW